MYAIYKQMHPPTGVELCTYCHFINGTEKNLVICAVNQLYVYRLNPDIEVGGGQTLPTKQFLCDVLKNIVKPFFKNSYIILSRIEIYCKTSSSHERLSPHQMGLI